MRVLSFIVLFLISSFAFSEGYSTIATITKFRALNADGNFVMLGNWVQPEGENCASSKWIVGAHPNASLEETKSMYSLIMAAYMSGQTVQLYVNGCDSAGRPIVTSIWMPSR